MAKKLIYIAGDEADICNIIKPFLEREGYHVETFQNGHLVLDAFINNPVEVFFV